MTPEYVAMIDEAARRLASAMRTHPNPRDLYVWAIHTTAERDGALQISEDAPTGLRLADYQLVRPNGYSGWSSVPYSAQRSQLLEVCRSVPILPIPRAASGHQDISHVTDADGVTRRLQTPVRVF